MYPLFLFGPSAVGKSTFGHKISDLLNADGVPTEFWTSKQWLGKCVLDDARDRIPNDADEIETDHMVLYNPLIATATTFEARFKSGLHFNNAHRTLIFDAANAYFGDDGSVFRVIELATGPRKKWGDGNIPTLQTGTDFLDWMEEAKILNEAHLLLVTENIGDRDIWNLGRDGAIPEVPYRDTYPPNYNYFDFDPLRPGRGFTHVKNNFPTPEEYLHDMVVTFHGQIAKQCGIEGFSLPPEYQVGGRNVEGGRGW